MYCSCFKDKLVGSSTSLSEEANCKWQESLPLCQPLNWKENKCQIHGKRQTDDELEIDVPFDIVDFAEGPKVRLRSLDCRYLHLILLYWVFQCSELVIDV